MIRRPSDAILLSLRIFLDQSRLEPPGGKIFSRGSSAPLLESPRASVRKRRNGPIPKTDNVDLAAKDETFSIRRHRQGNRIPAITGKSRGKLSAQRRAHAVRGIQDPISVPVFPAAIHGKMDSAGRIFFSAMCHQITKVLKGERRLVSKGSPMVSFSPPEA